MKKPLANKSQEKVKKFVAKNWVSLATLVISLSALFVAIQSNRVSKESNDIAAEAVNTNIKLVNAKPYDSLIIEVFGCYSRVTYKYEIVRHISGSATLTNTGGKGTALVATKFNDGSDRKYYPDSVNIYDSESSIDRKQIKLPLQLEASQTIVLYLNTVNQFDDFYDQKQPAIQSVQSLRNGSSKATWEFIFADGTTLTKKYDEDLYTISPFIKTDFDNECTY